MLRAAIAFLSLTSVALVSAGEEVKFVQTDEFNGPFPSWRDVKRDYGAKGDGVADDSDAINKALAELKKVGREFSVLYFPAGVYRVAKTLTTSPCKTHHEGSGISVVGEDPATTVIKWDGQDKGTVFSYTAWYSRISRLTIDGSGRAAIAMLYSGEKFSTYNETSDMIFKDSAVGLQLGGQGGDFGQAENMVLRCRFLNCGIGLRTACFNSLDIWVWNSLFADCGEALRNTAGDFRAYSCVFLRSKKCDITTQNLSTFDFTDNVSIGPATFLDFSGAPGGVFSGAPVSICGNRIYDCTGDQGAIRLGGGPSLLWGNTIRNRADNQGPAVFLGGDQGLFGNTYSAANPVAVLPYQARNGHPYSPRKLMGGESIVKRESIPDPKPVLPGVPAHVARKVFEVEPGSNAAKIQASIDAAAALKKGQRPVVHLPKGKYKIEKTLVIPAGTDLQIVGDGAAESATALAWTGAKGEFLMRVEGPGEASLRDFFMGNNRGNGIVFENCDRDGGCFYADRLNSGATSGAAVWVDGMDKSSVQFRCLAWEQGSLRVEGGKAGKDFGPIQGVTSVFCGTSGESKNKVFDVSAGATAILRGVYYDAGRVMPIVSMCGNGNLFHDSGICAAGCSPDFPMLKFQDFSGRVLMTISSLVECGAGKDAGPRLKLEGNCSQGSVLLFGNYFQAKSRHDLQDLFLNDSTPKCQNAGAYLSTFESPSLPGQILRLHDVPIGGTAAAHPESAMMRSLDFFAGGSRPRTPGIGDNNRVRIHSVNVKVNGETGVLLRGAK
jgi:hypothetical protein